MPGFAGNRWSRGGTRRPAERLLPAVQVGDVGIIARIPLASGLHAVEQIRPLVPEGWTMAQFALRWALMHGAVSTAIAGARDPDQARANASASELAGIPASAMDALATMYRDEITRMVHQRW